MYPSDGALKALLDCSTTNYIHLSLIYEIADRYGSADVRDEAVREIVGRYISRWVKEEADHEISKIRKTSESKLNNLFNGQSNLFDNFSSQKLSQKQQEHFLKFMFYKQAMSSIIFFLDNYENVDPFVYLPILHWSKYHHLTPYLNRAPYMKDKIVDRSRNQTFLFYVKKLDDFKKCIEFGMDINHKDTHQRTIVDYGHKKEYSAKTLEYIFSKIESKYFFTTHKFPDISPYISRGKNDVFADYIIKNPVIMKLRTELRFMRQKVLVNPFQKLFLVSHSHEKTEYSEIVDIVERFIKYDRNLMYEGVFITNSYSDAAIDPMSVAYMPLLHISLGDVYIYERFHSLLFYLLVKYDHSIIFYRRDILRSLINDMQHKIKYKLDVGHSPHKHIESLSNINEVIITVNSCKIPSLKTTILSNFYNPLWKNKINIPEYYPKMLFHNENNREKETTPQQLSLKIE